MDPEDIDIEIDREQSPVLFTCVLVPSSKSAFHRPIAKAPARQSVQSELLMAKEALKIKDKQIELLQNEIEQKNARIAQLESEIEGKRVLENNGSGAIRLG